MSNKLKQAAFTSFSMLVRPIARLMLHCGLTCQEAGELLRLAYVDVATQDYGKFGRPANASRVAILTGLSRRDVKRLRDVLATAAHGAFDSLDKLDHATRVLSGWHQDPDYLDAKGKPRLLALEGPRGFAVLAKRYAPDIPATAMSKELEHVGAVKKTPTGRLRAVKRVFMRDSQDVGSILRSGSVIADLASTVAYNQTRGEKPSSFERRATNRHVKRSAQRAFRAYLEKHGMSFLAAVDQWLTDHEAIDHDQPAVRLGVGVYLIKDD